MLTITNIELGTTYPTGDYKLKQYKATVEMRISGAYGTMKFDLSDEQTDRVVEFIKGVVGENLAVEVDVASRDQIAAAKAENHARVAEQRASDDAAVPPCPPSDEPL